jgi:AcrR family transcriptional regulator
MTNMAGRSQQAERNNEAILTAAREVFLADKRAPISAVAERAGVGISALYRRYASKEDMLRTLCADGLARFIAEAERAATIPGYWEAFESFLHGVVQADVHSLTVHLAGTFPPDEHLGAEATRASSLAVELFERARPFMRADAVPADITMILEMCAAARVPDAERTRELRGRYLRMLLDGLRAGGPLPGPAPTVPELEWRWIQATNTQKR